MEKAKVVGAIPEFTESASDEGIRDAEEVKEAVQTEEETETPTELPAEEKPAEEQVRGDDARKTQDAIQALQEEKAKLLKQIQELRGQKREIKKEELVQVNKDIEDLKDLNPEDVKVLDKYMRAKGYMPQEEINKMFYENVQKEELDKFLEKYPEYKPENDPSDVNWTSLQHELQYFRKPDDPRRMGEILEKAHKNISRISSDTSVTAKKQQVELAGKGSGGAQRSSPKKSVLTEVQKNVLRSGGWSEEDIKRMDSQS